MVVEAMQWTGSNADALREWTGGSFQVLDPEDAGENPDATGSLFIAANGVWATLELSEWILRDIKGFYPCKADVFELTYEREIGTPIHDVEYRAPGFLGTSVFAPWYHGR
ncbi:hypothetical protein ACFRAQ_35865 [Nocardia sp. NPDC056611]|uniref:hypothetical protein n=1 Tax=Nocardia sp. NPDC056611 TaxID=3345877 RepID=UPI003672C334